MSAAPLHADQLTDAAGTLEVRAAGRGEPARVLVDDEWRAVGTAQARSGGASRSST